MTELNLSEGLKRLFEKEGKVYKIFWGLVPFHLIFFSILSYVMVNIVKFKPILATDLHMIILFVAGSAVVSVSISGVAITKWAFNSLANQNAETINLKADEEGASDSFNKLAANMFSKVKPMLLVGVLLCDSAINIAFIISLLTGQLYFVYGVSLFSLLVWKVFIYSPTEFESKFTLIFAEKVKMANREN